MALTGPLLARAPRDRDMSRSKSLNTLVLEHYHGSAWKAAALWVASPLVIGAALGLLLPVGCSLPSPWNRVSQVIGWVSCGATGRGSGGTQGRQAGSWHTP